MRHRNAGFKLGRNTSHRRALLRNLTTSVIIEDRVETTVAKAKAVRPHVEKMITLGKKGDLHSRRQALSFLMTDKAVDAPLRHRGSALRRSPGRLSSHRPHRLPQGRRRAKTPSSNSSAPKSNSKSSAKARKDQGQEAQGTGRSVGITEEGSRTTERRRSRLNRSQFNGFSPQSALTRASASADARARFGPAEIQLLVQAI